MLILLVLFILSFSLILFYLSLCRAAALGNKDYQESELKSVYLFALSLMLAFVSTIFWYVVYKLISYVL